MAEREPHAQSIHDAVVRTVAENLAEDSDNVRADEIAGFEDPETVRGYVPDISVGSLPNRIFEVETDASDDIEQRRAFKRWAQEKSS